MTVTRNRLGFGNKNRICLQLDQGYAQITGNGSERDIAARHVFAPCKVMTETIRVNAVVAGAGAKTSVIKIYAGSDKDGVLVGTANIRSDAPTVLANLNNPGKIWEADQEFCLSEETSNNDTLDYLDATLCFRQQEA